MGRGFKIVASLHVNRENVGTLSREPHFTVESGCGRQPRDCNCKYRHRFHVYVKAASKMTGGRGSGGGIFEWAGSKYVVTHITCVAAEGDTVCNFTQ